MKAKLLIFLALMLTVSIVFIACKVKDKGNDGTEGGDNGTSDVSVDFIYKAGSSLGLRCDFELYASNELDTLSGNLYSTASLKHLSLSDEPMEHEIVIGYSDVEIARAAYEKLENMRLDAEQENNPEDYTKWLIYSDGKSVAIAFDENIDFISFKEALRYFNNNLLRESLELGEGIVSKGVINIYDYYKAADEKDIGLRWNALAASLGAEGASIVSALKNLYTLYDSQLVSWLANQYEPDVCICDSVCRDTPFCGSGAFYYSNSARDTQGFLPDVESTRQAFGIIEGSGMVSDYSKELPPEMMADVVKFVRALQAENGYFYHPQWGMGIGSSRRNRDLSSAIGILERAGATPPYDTPNGVKGDGIIPASSSLPEGLGKSAVSAVSKVIFTAVTDPNLQDKESFIKYLNDLDVRNNSYAAGNTLAAYCSVIKMRDKELAEAGADYKLFDIMINHLNENQNPETGTWYWVDESDPGYSLYYAVNGLMKISCVYETAWQPMPNCDKALESAMAAITSSADVTACVDIYNTWFAISNIFSILSHVGGADGAQKVTETRELLRANAPALINASRDKLNVFRKMDGSFSYGPKYSSYQSQGCLAAVPQTEEGDMNATNICSTGTVSLIYTCLGVDMVPMYGKADFYKLTGIISELERVIKDEMDTTVTVDNGNTFGKGKYKEQSLDFEKDTATKLLEAGKLRTDKPDLVSFDVLGAQNNVSIVDVEWDGGATKALSFKKTSNGDPYLYISAEKSETKSYVFEADICMLGGSTNFSDGAVLYFYLFNGTNTFWDGTVSLTKTSLYDEEMHQIYGIGVEDRYVTSSTWHNVRVEIQNVSSVGSDLRLYLDGTLIMRKKISKTAAALTDVGIRFRYDSGVQSNVLLDNLYFSSVENLENDTTPLIPPIDMTEIGGGLDVNSEKRGTGVYYDKAIKYSDTNATLLDIAGLIGTSGLTYDQKNTAAKAYAKVVKLNGDGALEMGKNNNTGDPYLMIPETEKKSGKAYVLETDILFISGTDKREEDDVVLEAFWAQGSVSSIFWNGSMSLTELEGQYTFNVGQKNAEGNGLSVPVEKLRWYNLRVEFDDVSKLGSEMRVYIDGALVHTAVLTRTANSISHFIIRYKLATNNGRLLLDNTYFAATGETLPETPVTPPTEPETPSEPEYSGTRGEGAYKDNENTVSFTDKTAIELGEAGIITANGGATLDGADIFVKVNSVDGDNALVLGNNQWNKQGYVNIKANGIGTKYIFETDLMLDSSVISPGSGRDGGTMFSFFTGSNDSTTTWFWTSPSLCYVDGEYLISLGNDSVKLVAGEWANLRVELDDATSIGSAVRYYVNGELVFETTLTKTSTELSHIRVWMTPTSMGTLTLDNICFITLDPKIDDGEDDGNTSGGGDNTEGGENTGGEGGSDDNGESGDNNQTGDGTDGEDGTVTETKRGSGVYAENANTLTYSDTTATALGESGKLVVTGSGALDGTNMSASVAEIDGDNALKLSNNQYSNEAYFNIKADSLGTKYVFETDIYIASGSSGRSDNSFLTFYSSNLDTAASTYWWGMPAAMVCPADTGSYKIVCGGKEVTVKADEWFNVRYEFVNTDFTGNEIRFYVNGELLYTGTNTKTTTGLHFIRVFTPGDSHSEIYLDNTYYSAVSAI